MLEGKVDIVARRQVTNKLQMQFRKSSKGDKGAILDRVVATIRAARSSPRRMLTGPRLCDPADQVDGSTLRQRVYSGNAWAL